MRARSAGISVVWVSVLLAAASALGAGGGVAGSKSSEKDTATAAPSGTPAAVPAGSPAPEQTATAPPKVSTTSGSGASSGDLLRASDVLGEDVLAKALRWNSSKHAKPASAFRAGGVKKRAVDDDTVARVGGGFRVRFASGSQVTTPAVYDGMLFVSGGFSSRELYAFDARSGKPIWALDLEDDGPSAPACADGVCVINTESCTLFVVKAKTGDLVWSKWLGDPLMAAATISRGRVFAAYPVTKTEGKGERPEGASHALAAFELKSGKLLWQKWIDGDVISSPVASGDRLWASTFSGTVYEFEQATGKIVTARRAKATSAPVVVAGNLFFSRREELAGGQAGESIAAYGYGVSGAGRGASGSGAGYVVAKKSAVYLDRATQSRSTLSAKGSAEDSANGFAGGAPAAANAGKAAALVGQASVSTLQAHQGSRILALPGKNVSSMGNEVVCTDAATGKKLWTVPIEGDLAKQGGSLATAPVGAGGFVLVGTIGGDVLQIDPKDGSIKKRFKVGAPVRAQPVVQDGWIYAGTADGRLIAIDTGDRSLTGWSQWGGDAERSSKAK